MDQLAWDALFHPSRPSISPFSDHHIIHKPTEAQVSHLLKSGPAPKVPRPLEDVMREAREILSYGFRNAHSRFFAVTPAPVSPVSWLGDALTSAFNPHAGSWEGGTGVVAIEKTLISWISERFGLPPSAGGHFVSGGSMATLTALTVARDQVLGDDIQIRAKGIAYVSEQSHFCVAKALRIIGFPEENIRTIPCDNNFRMNATQLRRAIAKDIGSGLKPFLVVATCGTTNTGSIDPIEQIAEVASQNHLWLHIDAAYGGSVAFSDTHESTVAGLKYADSIAWDAHKWLFQTFGCSAVIFRERTHPLKSFAARTDLLDSVADVDQVRDPWNYGIELTRPARHMRLWLSLQVLGMEKIDKMISRGFDVAGLVETEVSRLPDWEIVSPAQMAIITFRYAPLGLSTAELDRINKAISKELIDRNLAAIFTTRLKGVICLRMCTINPETTDDEIRQVVSALDQYARRFMQGAQRRSSKL